MNLCLLPWQADSYPLDHQGIPQQRFKYINILSNPGLKVLCISVTPAVELVSLDQKQITIHHLLFLSAYSRPGHLLKTLRILFPEPLRLGYDTAHCRVCWCEDTLPAGTCRQWPPSGDRLPHLELCPVSLPCPCVCTRSISDLPCVPSTPYTSILSLLASISPSCNYLATWNVRLPISDPEACKHHCSMSETLKTVSVLGEEKKQPKQLQSLRALTRIWNFPKATPCPLALLRLRQLKSDYACPQIISDLLWLAMASLRWA